MKKMKHAKKLASLLMALVMVLGMSVGTTVTAFAANTTISSPADSTRTYDVYQIFTGDLHEGVLSNVKWGKNGTGTEGASVNQATLDALVEVNGESDTIKLAEIEKYVNLNSQVFGTVSDGNPLTVPTGYYLIKDKGPVSEGETYSLYVVEVAGPTTISPKVSQVTSEKKVKDINDSTGVGSDWQDSADYDIGDKVPFQLKGTVAADYDKYTVYKFVFHDTESAGLTFDKDSVVVKVDNTVIDSGYTVVTEGLNDGCTFEIQFTDLKTIDSVEAGSVITVDYKSTLNENAVIGSTGNTNKMKLEYSNNPNDKQGGTTGNTPEDTVVVFSYKTIINKVDGDSKSLTGAAFKLEKLIKGADEAADTWTLVKKYTVDADNPASTFEFTGLDDGTYKLTETVTPAGYNTIDPISFEITASDNGTVITGLDGDNNTITFAKNLEAGSLSANVVNKAGSILPSTGGMGTTLLYIIGAILVVGAGVLLVARRRMHS